jgi:hypothetical protein
MGDKRESGPTFAVYESVRCLGCGSVYSKPTRGGTFRVNPGCPDCGYVGWLSLNLPVKSAPSPHRSDAGPQLGRSAQSR